MFNSRMPFWGVGHLMSSSSSPTKLKTSGGATDDGVDPADGSATRWIESGHFEPQDEADTMRQFLLDAPRMDVTVDGKPWQTREEPSGLLEYLFSILPTNNAFLAAEFCTQTALAPFFCSVKDTLPPEVHFVDGGRQLVRIDSDRSIMEIEKPFRVVEFNDNHDAKMLFMVTLIIQVNLESGFVHHRFTRSALVEKDWVYVEALSVEDEQAFDQGGGAEEVAASAERMRGVS
jgi:hypothetical protein